jgi:Protein of unknown function (DUF4199)
METTSTARIALKWGLISGLVSILFALVLYNTDLWKSSWVTGTSGIAITAVIITLAMREFKSLNNGFMSYGEGLGLGSILSVVSGVIGSIFNLVYMKFIDTTFIGKQLDFTEEKLIEQGMSDEQIEIALETTKKFTDSGFSFIFGVFGALFVGFLLSLIIAAILKKNKPVFE